MIQPDNTGASLAQQGFGQIDQMRKEAEAKRLGRMPAPQALSNYFQRVFNGEDPRLVAAEASAHPEVQQHVEGLRNGAQNPQDSVSHVGPGVGGPGMPGLYTPKGTRPDMPPMAGLPGSAHQMNQQSLGMQPTPSLAGGPALGGGQQSVPSYGSAPQQTLANMGQPMQGAPQVSPQQAGASNSLSLPQQPGGGPQVPRQDFGRMRGFTPNTDILSNDEVARMGPYVAGAEQTQSRERIASEQGKVKEIVQQMKSAQAEKYATLRAQGVDEATAAKLALGIMNEQGTQERFVEGEKGKTERAKIGADATKAAAGTRASAAEDPDEKRLRNLESRIAALKSKTDWEAQPDLKDMVTEFETEADAAAARLGKPRKQKPGSAPATTSPKAVAPAKAPPAQAGMKHVKLKNGKTGWVPAAKVDGTMTLIP